MARRGRRRRSTVVCVNASEEPSRANHANDEQGSNEGGEENDDGLANEPLERLVTSGVMPKLQYVKSTRPK